MLAPILHAVSILSIVLLAGTRNDIWYKVAVYSLLLAIWNGIAVIRDKLFEEKAGDE